MDNSTFLQLKRTALRDGNGDAPSDGCIPKRGHFTVDIPAQDNENLLIQVLNIRMPLTYEVSQEIQEFQKRFGLDTQSTANLIMSLGIVQLKKLADSPLVEPE